jgi:hypothetical protein
VTTATKKEKREAAPFVLALKAALLSSFVAGVVVVVYCKILFGLVSSQQIDPTWNIFNKLFLMGTFFFTIIPNLIFLSFVSYSSQLRLLLNHKTSFFSLMVAHVLFVSVVSVMMADPQSFPVPGVDRISVILYILTFIFSL